MSPRKSQNEIRDEFQHRDRIHVVMTLVSAGVLVLAAIILLCILNLQLRFRVSDRIIGEFRPKPNLYVDHAVRGRILAQDGRPLAVSAPLYDVYMDCAVRKQEFIDQDRQEDAYIAELNKKKGNKEPAVPKHKGAAQEAQWGRKVDTLSQELAILYPARSAAQYKQMIMNGRERGRRHLRLFRNLRYDEIQTLSKCTLLREGRYLSGMITEEHPERIYPYDSLARRVIGYVKDSLRRGLEASYDYELHGRDGHEWRRITDSGRYVQNFDSTVVQRVDGNDIRTTLNIDFQTMADQALRRQIAGNPQVQGGIAVIMDVHTGAIRAMVNLMRDSIPGSPLWERENLVLRQVGEQGSVMKTVTLVTLVEDGYVKTLEQTVPTHGGELSGYPTDTHIIQYENKTHRSDISVLHGFEISSNYVFSYLPVKYYGDDPKAFFDHIYTYRMGDRFDFDIPGMGAPVVHTPRSPDWSPNVLGSTGYGYGISITPLHVVTFYNAIANKGKMMKPYLVECVEKDGKVLKQYGPSVLNSICSPATADTVTRALKAVVHSDTGTGTRLRGARLPVCGKTGTARVALSAEEGGSSKKPYENEKGQFKNQGTFVGFFPADDPQYTVLVTVYSYLTKSSFYGGDLPARTVREIVDNIYALDGQWGGRLHPSGTVPAMQPATTALDAGKAPDVKGFCLADALYAIERQGLYCQYTGSGHVTAQTPAAGASVRPGDTIRLTLK